MHSSVTYGCGGLARFLFLAQSLEFLRLYCLLQAAQACYQCMQLSEASRVGAEACEFPMSTWRQSACWTVTQNVSLFHEQASNQSCKLASAGTEEPDLPQLLPVWNFDNPDHAGAPVVPFLFGQTPPEGLCGFLTQSGPGLLQQGLTQSAQRHTKA
eukprot:1138128-Pelagomonas_calceolata.AAC.3